MVGERTKNGFEKVLNRHGYGFHYSVLRTAHDLSEKGASSWVFEAAEFPVQVPGGRGTRIDFILKHQYSPIYILAECKRANPALRHWCFAKAPYVRRNHSKTKEPLFIERVELHTGDGVRASSFPPEEHLNLYSERYPTLHEDAYHIAREVKSQQKGDPHGSRGSIEGAATQVCRGLNGMVQCMAQNPQLLERSESGFAYLLPVIFTTAQIWTSDVDLGAADLQEGTVDLQEATFEQKPWIYYQYHVSPGIKHSRSPMDRPSNMGSLLDQEFVRTIVVVSASGVQDFLRWANDLLTYVDLGYY